MVTLASVLDSQPGQGKVLRKIAHTPVLPENLTGFTPAKLKAQQLEENRWNLSLLWTAYLIYPNIDVTRKPFQKPAIKRARPWGEFLFHLLQITRVCWENDPQFRSVVKKGNPVQIWAAIVFDLKIADIHRSWGEINHGKIEEGKGWSGFSQALAQGYQYAPDGYFSPCFELLIASAQRMRKRLKKGKAYRDLQSNWDEMLFALDAHAKTFAESGTRHLTATEDGSAINVGGSRNKNREVKLPFPVMSTEEVSAMSGLKISQKTPEGLVTWVYRFDHVTQWDEQFVFVKRALGN